jgi:hypothetical protein
MVINPHFANLPHVTSPVSQTVNQGQISQGINALADFGGLGQPGQPAGVAPPDPAGDGHAVQAGAPIGYNPSPTPVTSQPGGLLPPTGLESQPIAVPQPKFTFAPPPYVDMNPGMGFFAPSHHVVDPATGQPASLAGIAQQQQQSQQAYGQSMLPNPDQNQYPTGGTMYTRGAMQAQPGSGAMGMGMLAPSHHVIDPAQAAAQSQYAHAMPGGLTEQQQFDYLNPRGPDGRPLYQY